MGTRKLQWAGGLLLASLLIFGCDDDDSVGGDGADAARFDGQVSDQDVPDDGVFPDEGVDPDEGVLPDEGVDPDEGVLPDEGVDPDEGVLPDEGVDPDEGVLPDPDQGVPPECEEEQDCDDEDPCTIDQCMGESCERTPVAGCCTDDTDCDAADGTPGVCLDALLRCAAPAPAGAIVITEIMADPLAVDDAHGEWVEIFNRGLEPVLLNGWTLAGTGPEAAFIDSDTAIALAPGQHFLLGRAAENNGGVSPDYVYAGFSLVNGGDRVALLDALGGLVDQVAYDESFPLVSGASLSLSLDRTDPVANDLSESWCGALSPWTAGGDLGTPGAANPFCPGADTTVDWCRYQHPARAEVFSGAQFEVFGVVYEAGLTDRTDGIDPAARLVAQAGFGPDGSDPAMNADWVWSPAAGNPDWNAAEAGQPNNDEYIATVLAPAPGEFDLAYRFSVDGGDTWTYCDEDAEGSATGYSPETAAVMVSAASPCEGDPCDAAPADACVDGVTMLSHNPIGACDVVGDVAVCTYDSTEIPCGDDVCDAGACVAGAPRPGAGEVVFTELMFNPEAPLEESAAEWIELYNTTDHVVRLDGCLLADSNSAVALTPVTMAPNGYALLVRSADPARNGGLVPDALFPFGLNNAGDHLVLNCQDTLVDELLYDGTFPGEPAAAIALDLAHVGANASILNDLGSNWCAADAAYTHGVEPAHLGTPGAANPACPVADVTIDWCRLQWPLDVEAGAGATLPVYGRVFEAGLTDLSCEVNVDPAVRGEVGVGPAGSVPGVDGWVWFDAAPNPDWCAEPGNGNDEYVAALPVPEPGAYDFAFRFTRDAGETWTLCDREAGAGSDGSEDGYQSQNAGHLTSLGSPCEDAACDTPPAPSCADARILEIPFAPGACEVVEDAAVCHYPTEPVDCGLDGGRCEAGACVGGAAAPMAGAVLFSEIMYDPDGELSDVSAEWFELHNVTDAPLALNGCTLDDGGAPIAIDPLVIEADGYLLFARTADPALNGGLAINQAFGFGLTNSGETLSLRCGDLLIDAVTYDDGLSFPDGHGASIALEPTVIDALGNDDGANWCLGTEIYYVAMEDGVDNFGTPGAANTPCPVPDVQIDYCRFQAPMVAAAEAQSGLFMYGVVFEAGVTDRTAQVDVDPSLVAQAGFGPRDSQPGANWQWTPADANVEWDGVAAGEAGADEYMAQILVPAPGLYDLAYRFSRDGGQTWLYCDGADGSNDGYTVANAGKLEALAPNAACDPNPCDAPPVATCDEDGVTRLTYAAEGQCNAVDGQAECAYPIVRQVCEAFEACLGGACVPAPHRAGDLLITEIMNNPHYDLADATAEWFELHNPTGTPLNLVGCTLSEGGGSSVVIGDFVAAPDSYTVVARSLDPALNGGISPDLAFNFALGNTGETLTLSCRGTVIDAVTYDDGPEFPAMQAHSLSLDPSAFDAGLNDAGSNWCLGRDPYYVDADGDNLGTPGEPNDPCPREIGFCRLQFPEAVFAEPGQVSAVYGRVFVEGLTDQTPQNDADPMLIAQVGVGADGSDPAVNWMWTPAAPNAAWQGAEPNNDEYVGELRAPLDEGAFDFAYRFSANGGDTWTYCDLGAGTVDGYAAADAGELVVVRPASCDPNPCDNPPANDCADANTTRTFPAQGLCEVVANDAICTYAPVLDDCAANFACEAGACVEVINRPDVAGEVIFTEVMPDPTGDVSDATGEWFELYNPTAEALVLDGCEVAENGGSRVVIEGLTIEPGAFALFARSANIELNGLLEPDHLFGFAIGNSSETLTLSCADLSIDAVSFDGSYRGASFSLDREAFDAGTNDLPDAWCAGRGLPYDGLENFGTPGAPNPLCEVMVGFCRLQHPAALQLMPGGVDVIYGRVYVEGITDLSVGVDLDADLLGELGWGPEGTDPAVDVNWMWEVATANPDWDDASEPNNDEYEALIGAPAEVGIYSYGYRFSADAGNTWTYCDLGEGSGDGYQTANAGVLEVLPMPVCDGVECLAPPVAHCVDPMTARIYADVGVCADVLGAPTCSYDTIDVNCDVGTVCEAGDCVPDACAGVECIDPPADHCVDPGTVRIFELVGVCELLGGQPSCRYENLDVACDAGTVCVGGACVLDANRPTVEGDVIFTEVMPNPGAPIDDANGEWFELHNPTAEALVLDGCEVVENGGSRVVIEGLTIEPGAFALFARSANIELNGLIEPDHLFGFSIGNSSETLALNCGDAGLIDAVDFGGAYGSASFSLDLGAFDHVANDDAANWCAGRAPYDFDEVNHGTPGLPNPPCAVPVGFCRLQHPEVLELVSGDIEVVYGRVYVEGITDQTAGVDAHPDLLAQLGLGPDGSDPVIDQSWLWTPATPNPDWDDASEPNNDEYEALIEAPAEGFYNYAYRFSADGGNTWTVCDAGNGSGDGYAPVDAGLMMVSAPDVCLGVVCETPPADNCLDGDTAQLFDSPGVCVEVAGQPECVYDIVPVDCDVGQICEGGACVAAPNVCDGVVCETPPADNCLDVDTVQLFDSPGVCHEMSGLAECLYDVVPVDCAVGQVCDAGACVAAPDVCAGVVCDAPPADTVCFDDHTVQIFRDPGVCQDVAGVGVCEYATENVACAPSLVCVNGDCVPPGPLPGELVITEIMQNPSAVGDDVGEWFELLNVSDHTINLNGLHGEEADAGDPFTVDIDVFVLAGGYAIFAHNDDPAVNGGLEKVDVLIGGALANGSDQIILTFNGQEIDRVEWDGGPAFPDPTGASMTLDGALDPGLADNAAAVSWCTGRTPFGAGDLGTPGAPNPPCSVPVGFCRLQHPVDVAMNEGDVEIYYGHVYIEGVTDRTAGTDVDVNVLVEVGYGPDGSDPVAHNEWVWTPAEANLAWDDANEPNNDEYEALIGEMAPAIYDTAFRASADGGASWTYCDTGAGSDDGYDAANAGHLVVNDLLCLPNPCNIQPPNDCGDPTTVQIYALVGACEEGVDAPICTYEVVDFVFCDAGMVCDAGACVPDVVEEPVDFCRLQWPLDLPEMSPGDIEIVYGRVYEAGVTDRTNGTDVDERLVAEFGFGPNDSDPAGNQAWTWAVADANPDYDSAGANDEDEYEALFEVPAAGDYDFAYRFSADLGRTWTYCDRGEGSGDGYTPANAGQLHVLAPVVEGALFFSEYIEGGGSNKCVELYNAGAEINLGDCAVQVFANGAAAPSSSVALEAIALANGATYVVCNNQATADFTGRAQLLSGSLSFNGDDAVALVCLDVTLDVIGQIGFDPGSAWGAGEVTTVNDTIRRQCGVMVGDPNGADVFDPAAQWTGFAQDTFDGLGAHNPVCP